MAVTRANPTALDTTSHRGTTWAAPSRSLPDRHYFRLGRQGCKEGGSRWDGSGGGGEGLCEHGFGRAWGALDVDVLPVTWGEQAHRRWGRARQEAGDDAVALDRAPDE